ncbi:MULTISPECIES: hypothetical protein [Halomicrobium]|uniref:ABC-2 type transport system permease protein n=2 Tax=Halomicrobium mukohataei TaxID=57705 RepID=C7NZC5_HALMD|nr:MULTISPECIES: hypothetical protein [Halomicrobium]ACV46811.1 hypothetical protein Hmuk_0680 [Halomicrobium mukohataei DSM 12286]QCD65313.1 hypothetical protein E5139_06575 [Halomicrobium mukohataei]QFR20119.1 hypothetical protein GBQ70_06570 [Halomicrobium sp. ZPS1]
MRRSDLRDGAVLARTELRAQVRRIAGNRRQLVGVVVGLLSFGLFFPLTFLSQVLTFAEGLASGAPPLARFGTILVSVLTVGVYFGAATAINQTRVGAIGPLVRTSIPPEGVVIGRFASETLQATAFAVVPGVVLLVVLVVGAGTPLPALLVLAASLPLLVAGLVAGRTIGATVRYLGLLSRLSAWGKAVVLVVLAGTAFVGLQTAIPAVMGDDGAPSVSALLPGQPLQAYASVVAAPLGATPRPLGVAVAAVVLAAVPVGLAAALRIESALLFDDRGDQSGDQRTTSRSVPRVLAATPATRIAWRYLLRTRRNPKLVSHLSMVLFGALAFAGSLVSQPELLMDLGPGAAVVAGSVLAGATFCLNPMGDDREQLPLLLTSTASTRHLLRGRVVGGLVVGGTVALGVGLPLGLVSDPPLRVLGRTLLTPVVLLAAAGTALGVGAVVPKFERSEYMNVERAHPSTLGTLTYFFGTLVVVGIGLALVWLSVDGGGGPLLVGAWIVYLAVLAATGVGGYRYAVGKFDRLTIDDV